MVMGVMPPMERAMQVSPSRPTGAVGVGGGGGGWGSLPQLRASLLHLCSASSLCVRKAADELLEEEEFWTKAQEAQKGWPCDSPRALQELHEF